MFNVGNAFVTVAPRFNNFQTSVRSQVRGVMPQVGRDAGKEMGRGIGKGAEQGISDELPGLRRSAESAGAAVGKAAERAVAARDKSAGAVGRLRVAEEKLKEVRGNTNATASQIAAAEERVADARRKSESAAREADTAQQGYVSSMKQSTAAHTTLDAAVKQSARVAEAEGRRGGRGFIGRMVDGLKGGGARVSNAVRGSLANTANIGRTAGTSLGGAFMGAASRMLAPLAGLIGGGAILAGGFNRLANIEDADAKLRGLGHSAETVEEAMNSALESVRGTAFGLDEAATIAAGLMAAGVKPGEELEGVLRNVADAATIAGTDMGSMGSIFGKVAANGKLQGDEIMQLSDRGIPILQLLGESLGKNAEEVRKMASDGKIGFKEFSDAMQKGMGGAALKSGETTRGTLRNVGAAASRLGATMLEHVFPLIKQGGALLISVLDQIADGFKLMVGWIQENWDWLGKLVTAVAVFGGALVGLIAGVKIVMALRAAWALLSAAITANWVVLAIAGIVAAVVMAYREFEWFRNVVDGAMAGLVSVFDRVKDGVKGIFDLLVRGDYTSALSDAFGIEEDHPLVGFLLNVRDKLWEVGEYITGSFVPALQTAGEWVEKHRKWFELLGAAVGGALGAYGLATGAIHAHAGAIQAWNGAVQIASSVQSVFSSAIGLVTNATKIATGAQALWNAVLAVNPIMLIVTLIGALVGAFIYLWNTSEGFRNFWLGAWGMIQDAVGHVANWFSDTVVPLFEAAWSGIRGATDAVVGWFTGTAAPLFEGAWSGMQGAAAAVVGWFQTHVAPVFVAVFDAVSGAISWAWNNVIQPVFAAIGAAWEAVGRAFQTVYNVSIKPLFDAIGAVVGWLWDTIIYPTFYNISQFVILAFDLVVYAWKNLLRPALEAFGGFLWKLWTDNVKQVFGFIGSAWGGMVNGIRDLWNGVLAPVFGLVGAVVVALWTNYVQGALANIRTAWGGMVNGIRDLWNGVLRPVVDAVGRIFTWLWQNVASPVFGWIADRWNVTVTAVKHLWDTVLAPAIRAVGAAVSNLWSKYAKPALKWIGDAWGGMVNGIRDVWNEVLKPVFKAVGDFVHDEVVRRVRAAVDMIGDAWSGLKRLFATPINWVIREVWNKGIVKTFNSVADAIGSKAKLHTASEIALGSAGSGKGNSLGSGGVTTVGARAKGGPVKPGQPYLVGEEGPEIIWPSLAGWVSTARQSQEHMARGQDVPPNVARAAAGSRPSEAILPMGGNIITDTLGALGSGLGSGIGWIVGQLAQGARKIIDPLLNVMTGALSGMGLMGRVSGDMIRKAADMVFGWAGKEDDKGAEGGMFGGMFAGAPGRFHRPSRGPITSWFGPRWGTTHAGVDIAGGGPTYAAWNGVVQKTGNNIIPGRTGLGILLNHGKSLWSYYGHNPVGGVRVRPGQEVKAGQHIGYQGNTGNVFKGGPGKGIHVHFEANRGAPGRLTNINALFRDQGGELPPGLSLVLNNTRKREWVFNDSQLNTLDAAVMANQAPRAVILQVGDTEIRGMMREVSAEHLAELRADADQYDRQLTGE